MKTIAVIALLGLALAQEFETANIPKPVMDGNTAKIHYRKFHPQMVGETDNNGERWWKDADPNYRNTDEGKVYYGPHNTKNWKMSDSKKAYYSYDSASTKTDGFKYHNHKRADIKPPKGEQWASVEADDSSAEAQWAAYMKMEKYFSIEHNAGKKKGGYRSKDIEGPESEEEAQLTPHADHADTYMQEKKHLPFFKVNTVCTPEVLVSRSGGEGDLIKGLENRHNSGGTYQGCTLDNCAITVMYACSYMCTSCEAKWCRDECQKQKERSGSCFKLWESISPDQCHDDTKQLKLSHQQEAGSSNYILNPDAPLS